MVNLRGSMTLVDKVSFYIFLSPLSVFLTNFFYSINIDNIWSNFFIV